MATSVRLKPLRRTQLTTISYLNNGSAKLPSRNVLRTNIWALLKYSSLIPSNQKLPEQTFFDSLYSLIDIIPVIFESDK